MTPERLAAIKKIVRAAPREVYFSISSIRDEDGRLLPIWQLFPLTTEEKLALNGMKKAAEDLLAALEGEE